MFGRKAFGRLRWGGPEETAAVGGGTGKLKWWSGSAWEEKPVKWWSGAAWVEKPLKVWNGSSWTLA